MSSSSSLSHLVHYLLYMLKRGFGYLHWIQISAKGSKNGLSKGQFVMLWKIKALCAYYSWRSFIVWGPKIQFLALRLDWKMVGLRFSLHLVFKIISILSSRMNSLSILLLIPWTWVEFCLILRLIYWSCFNCFLVISILASKLVFYFSVNWLHAVWDSLNG